MDDLKQELADKFSTAQQQLVDAFKDKLKSVADGVISNFYTDVCNYATSDAHTNYYNLLRDEFRSSMKEEILSKNSYYSWAHSIRMDILKNHKEELANKIISDLQDRISSLEEHIENMRKFR